VDEPVALSASAVEALSACPLHWFLGREAGGNQQSSSAQGFGSILHALAAGVLDGEVAAETEPLMAELDRVWGQLQFPVSWASDGERREAESALGRFLDWHHRDRGRTPVAAEAQFDVIVPAGDDAVRLRGSMDRVELDSGGRAVVVDLKTSKTAPTEAAVAEHPQLGVYQLAVSAGALDERVGRHVESGGAELVQLRKALRTGAKVQHQAAPDDEHPLPAIDQVARAVATLRDEQFLATVGPRCGYCEFHDSCPAQLAGRTLLAAPEPVRGVDEPLT
jgi:RecB family exonuclease